MRNAIAIFVSLCLLWVSGLGAGAALATERGAVMVRVFGGGVRAKANGARSVSPALAASAYPADAWVFPAERGTPVTFQGWYCYKESDCSSAGTVSASESSPPQHGSIGYRVESMVAPPGDYCAGNVFPVTLADYTWTDSASGVDFFSTHATVPGTDCSFDDSNFLAQLPPPAKNLGQPDCCEGNPVNAGTGNKFQVETDYVGAAHTQLEFRRYYNSQDQTNSPLGANWHSTYHRGLTVSGNSVQVTRADGRVDTYTLASGAWQADPDVTDRLAAAMTNTTQTGWQLTTADDSVETYSLDGRLQSIATRAGLVTQLAYDASNHLIQVTGPFGHKLSFAYDAYGTLSQMTAPDNKTYAYTYDYNNNPDSVTYPDGTIRYQTYENAPFVHALTGIFDENGERFATYAYDDQGRAVSTEHAGGAEKTTLVYNPDGSASVTDPRGNLHGYTFTTQFDRVKPTAVSGTPVPNAGGKVLAYNANGFVASRIDFRNIKTNYLRDSRGLEISRTEAVGKAQARTIKTTWHPSFHLPTQITEPNRVTTFTYDSHGNPTGKTVTAGSLSRTWTYTYNAKGQVTQVDGPRTDIADTTQYAYDSQGNLVSITDALGHVTTLTADANGRPLTVTDPNGLTTRLAYDPRGRLVSLDVGGEVTTYAYDAAGQLLKTTLPDGSYLAYTYDAAHRLIQINDNLGNQIAYTLDASGNRTQE